VSAPSEALTRRVILGLAGALLITGFFCLGWTWLAYEKHQAFKKTALRATGKVIDMQPKHSDAYQSFLDFMTRCGKLRKCRELGREQYHKVMRQYYPSIEFIDNNGVRRVFKQSYTVSLEQYQWVRGRVNVLYLPDMSVKAMVDDGQSLWGYVMGYLLDIFALGCMLLLFSVAMFLGLLIRIMRGRKKSVHMVKSRVGNFLLNKALDRKNR